MLRIRVAVTAALCAAVVCVLASCGDDEGGSLISTSASDQLAVDPSTSVAYVTEAPAVSGADIAEETPEATTQTPVTPAPVTQAPVTQAPVTQAPDTVSPPFTTQQGTFYEPVTVPPPPVVILPPIIITDPEVTTTGAAVTTPAPGGLEVSPDTGGSGYGEFIIIG